MLLCLLPADIHALAIGLQQQRQHSVTHLYRCKCSSTGSSSWLTCANTACTAKCGCVIQVTGACLTLSCTKWITAMQLMNAAAPTNWVSAACLYVALVEELQLRCTVGGCIPAGTDGRHAADAAAGWCVPHDRGRCSGLARQGLPSVQCLSPP